MKSTFPFLLLLLAASSRAANFVVSTSNGDASVGSWGAAVADSSASGAAVGDTINSVLSSGSTIVLTQDVAQITKNVGVTTAVTFTNLTLNGGADNTMLNISGGGTFNVSGINFTGTATDGIRISGARLVADTINANVTMTGGTLRTPLLTGNLNITSSATLESGLGGATVSGVISGGQLVSNAPILVLSNAANTYSGGTSVQASSNLRVVSDGSLGTGNIQLGSNASLQAMASFSSNKNISVNSSIISTSGGSTLTLNGRISGGALTFSGTTFVLNAGNNNWTNTNLLSGLVSISQTGNLGSGTITFNGGSLRGTGNFTLNNNMVANSTANIDTFAGSTVTLTGVLAGGQGLNKTGAGALVLTGANTCAGSTLVAGGALAFNDGASLCAGTVTLINGAALRSNAAATVTQDIVLDTAAGGAAQTNGQAATLSLSGLISGSGPLTVSGGGVVSLNNTNTYSGGTVVTGGATLFSALSDAGLGDVAGALTLDNGTLQTGVVATDLSTRSIVLGSGGGEVSAFTAGETVSMAGVVSGAGALRKTGDGVLVLAGANTYAGGTSVEGGILSIGGDQSLGTGTLALSTGTTLRTLGQLLSTRNVVLNGDATLDTQGNIGAFFGDISGPGRLSVAGGGDIFLLGDNGDIGGISMTGGTLSVAGAGSLGAASGTFSMDSAAFHALGDLDTAQALSLAGSSTVDTKGRSVRFSGGVSGAGALTKEGAGTLTLAGANAFGGDVTVNGGTLALSGPASLGDVHNGGTLSLGGAVTAASYDGTGTLQVTLVPGAPSLTVSGAADMTGTTLVLHGRPANGVYTVVSANALTPLFASLSTPSVGKLFTPSYDAGDLTLTVQTLSSLAAPGRPAVAAALDAAAAASTGALDDTIVALNALSPATQSRALTQVSGASAFGAMSGMAFSGSRAQSAAVSRRTAALRTSAAPAVFQVADGGVSDVPTTYFSGDKWGVFASLLAGAGKQDMVDDQPGYDHSSNGVALGIDRRMTDGLSLGVSLGALSAKADIQDDGGSVENASLRCGVYGTATQDKFFETLYVGAASNDFDNRRRIAALGQTAAASPSGKEINIDLQTGYQWKPSLALLAGLAHDSLTIDGYTETGAGAMNLTVGGQNAESLRFNAGVKTARRLEKKESVFTPSAALSLLHEFKDQGRAVSASLASVGAFQTQTADVSRTGAQVALGLGAAWAKGFSANAAYTGEFRSGYSNHTVTGGLRKTF